MRVHLILAVAAMMAWGPGVRAEQHAVAPACPALIDREADKSPLLDALRTARDETDAQLITGFLWRIWTAAPDPAAQEMLDHGMARLRGGDLPGARQVLGDLVAYCPDWAEGWNQRAYVAFLMRDYAAALPDLEQALRLDPRHVPALAGKALTLFGLERDAEARDVLRDAVAMNPWLRERVLLDDPDSTDI